MSDPSPPASKPSLTELLSDLDAEYRDLRSIVQGFGDTAVEWDRPTPAEGWAVRDQISHLAYFDDAGRLAADEPEQFASLVTEVMEAEGDPMEAHLRRGRAMDGGELLAWWERAHLGMMAAFTDIDPDGRVPWFGPSMGARSFLSARLMETWAHGQDVIDALGVERTASDRLRHICQLGVRARPYSYVVRGLDVPPGVIDLVLTAPSGAPWLLLAGDEGSGGDRGSIRGQALDFCLVVTQRRHVDDTQLEVDGPLAEDWLRVAQAFAGPAGTGRPALG